MAETTAHLLPSYSTPLERALSRSSAYEEILGGAVDALRTAKLTDIPDSYLPALIFEYGLEELTPYLRDPREALDKGLQWQRIKGTPQSLSLAMAWIGFDAGSVYVEESGTGSVHWNEYQMDLGEVPQDVYPDYRQVLNDIVNLATISQPARSKLARLYHGYDVRRLKLSESDYGALLSDYSGVYDEQTGLILSFGHIFESTVVADRPDVFLMHLPTYSAHAKYEDRYLLDYGTLSGQAPLINPIIMHGRQFTESAVNEKERLGSFTPVRKFAKAQIVLSDSGPLGDTNSRTPLFRWVQDGEVVPISEGLSLSNEAINRLYREPINECFDVVHGISAAYDTLSATGCTQRLVTESGSYRERTLRLSESVWYDRAVSYPRPRFIQVDATVTMSLAAVRDWDNAAVLDEQYWTDTYWPDSTWADTQEVIGATHTTTTT